MTIGEKIRRRRKELGLTQREVAGETVTRNLICRIEAGECLPSLDSLRLIADALSVPVAYLLSDGDDLGAFLANAKLPTLRKYLVARRYADCISTVKGIPDDGIRDEVALIAARASLGLAERAIWDGNLKNIPVYVEDALAYADRTVLDTAYIRARCELCRTVAKNPQSPRWEIRSDEYKKWAQEAVSYDVFLYLTESDALPAERRVYLRHREARGLIAQKKFKDALPILLSIEEQKGSGELGPYFLFRVYSDTEICYRELGDFENAYRYSTKRVSLLNEFRI